MTTLFFEVVQFKGVSSSQKSRFVFDDFETM